MIIMKASLTTVMLLAIAPIFEARGALTFGMINGMNPLVLFPIALLLNILAIIGVLVFLDYFYERLVKRCRWLSFVQFFIEGARRKTKFFVEKFGHVGVGIVSMTIGGYTAAIATFLFGINRKLAVISICLGILASCLLLLAFASGVA